MKVHVAKALVVCAISLLLPNSWAALNEESITNLTGTYRTLDPQGRKIITVIEQREDHNKRLVMHESLAGEINTIFDFLPSIDKWNTGAVKTYKYGKGFVGEETKEYQVSDSKITVITTVVFKKNKVVETREFTLGENVLNLKLTQAHYKQKFHFVGDWILSKDQTQHLTLQKTAAQALSDEELLEETVTETERLNAISKVKEEGFVQKVLKDVEEGDNVVHLDTSVNKAATQQRARPADVISYEKFMQYKEEKRCDAILNGEGGGHPIR